jgi:hypothetical protein
MKATAFKLPFELVELSLQALQAGHRIKLSTLLKPIPSREEIEAEADLWEEYIPYF